MFVDKFSLFLSVQINAVFFLLLVASHVHAGPLRDRNIDIDAMMTDRLDATSRPTLGQHLVEDMVEDIVISQRDGESTAQIDNDDNLETRADPKMTRVLPDTSPVVEEIVIRQHEDEAIVPAQEDVAQEPALQREVDEMFVEPMGEEYVLVPVDDFMELAESGLVFRPKFRYSSKTRRRLGRMTRRRTRRSTAS